MSINPFNITDQLIPENNANGEPETICVICQEDINSAQSYELPECKHRYHTHCIVTWFRSQMINDYDITSNYSACPLCGNKGINYVTSSKKARHRRYRPHSIKSAESIRKKFIMNYAKKNKIPSQLTKLIEQEKNTKLKLEKVVKELKELKHYMKNNTNPNMSYNDMRKKKRLY